MGISKKYAQNMYKFNSDRGELSTVELGYRVHSPLIVGLVHPSCSFGSRTSLQKCYTQAPRAALCVGCSDDGPVLPPDLKERTLRETVLCGGDGHIRRKLKNFASNFQDQNEQLRVQKIF